VTNKRIYYIKQSFYTNKWPARVQAVACTCIYKYKRTQNVMIPKVTDSQNEYTQNL